MPRHLTEFVCSACRSPFLARMRLYVRRYCSNECRLADSAVALGDRFWDKVDQTSDCWLWTGQRNVRGYGLMNRSEPPHRRLFAHRVSWELTNGPITGGLLVCHHCDNPPCVRPDHLFLGTNADNLQDMVAKGRHRPWDRNGAKNPAAKLTADDVRRIRSDYAAGVSTQMALARKHSVSGPLISAIITRRAWDSVP